MVYAGRYFGVKWFLANFEKRYFLVVPLWKSRGEEKQDARLGRRPLQVQKQQGANLEIRHYKRKQKEGGLPFGFAQGKKSCPYTSEAGRRTSRFGG